ncbi:MAG: cell division/cell wall cluster transcriptional repressor MraZ [Clostridia bacterium]|jgi:MraZ protein|nr:cell division/cell wall cluster transcriptional repressor MraZ [Clostridia bacterium]MBQ4245078.1 cell division/cell wall cluster transcriptional repressor MraZ [Clostridia bacterium]
MFVDFMGKYRHNLDQKNRLAVPTKLRGNLGTEFVVCRPLTEDITCLYLYSLEGWQDLVERISEKFSGENRTKIQRKLFLNAERVECDTQGRFTIRADFCEYAKFEKEVVVFGAGQRIELWKPEFFSKVEADTTDLEGIDLSVIDY